MMPRSYRRSLGETVYAEMEEAADRAARSGWEPDWAAIECELLADSLRRAKETA